MKKMFFWAALAIMTAVSCNKEIETPAVSENVKFIATVDGAETKTVLGAEYTPMWTGTEKIAVFDATNTAYAGSFEGLTAPAASAELTVAEGFTEGKALAVYPQSGTYTADVAAKTVSGIVIPEKQVLAADTYDASAAVSVAYSEDNTLQFRNAVALVAFKVADADITKGAIYANNGKGDISGKFDLALTNVDGDKYDYEVPVLTAKDAKQWVDFNVNEGTLSTEKTYYIAVAPSTFPEGLAISLNEKEVKKISIPVELKRNVIYYIGTLTMPEEVLPETWYLAGSMNSWGKTPMTLEGDWHVLRNQTLLDSDEFKFRGEDWSVTRGGVEEAMVEGKEYAVKHIATGGNLKVAASAIYDVYLAKTADKMKVVKVGDYVAPDVKAWCMAGGFNNWTPNDTNYSMTKEGDFYVFKNFVLTTNTEMKFVVGSWSEELGGDGTAFGSDAILNLLPQGECENLKVTAGTYDVYLDDVNKKGYFMTDGKTPDQAGTLTVEPYDISKIMCGLSGSFAGKNHWTNPPSEGYMASYVSHEDNVATYKVANVALAPGDELKLILDGAWCGGTLNEDFSINVTYGGGDNVKVPEGISGNFDIYITFKYELVGVKHTFSEIKIQVAPAA